MFKSLKKSSYIFTFLSLFNFASYGQNTDELIDSLLQQLTAFKQVISNPDKYDLQIIFTEIQKDKAGKRLFITHQYRTNLNEYFYCASMVKLPTAALALEKAEELKIDKNWTLATDSMGKCQRKVIKDTSSENKKPSLSNYIKRILLISDNEAYNRTLDFVTLAHANKRLHEMGYSNSRLYHNFDARCSDRSTSRPVTFFDNNGAIKFRQEATPFTNFAEHPLGTPTKGKAYLNANDHLIKKPKDYSRYNYLPLIDVHDILQSLIFPESTPENRRFKISEESREFLLTYLKMYPAQSLYPRYTKKQFPDKYKKYLLMGDGKFPADSSISIYNIVGQSYGDLSDCAYIVDSKNNIGFILAAAIYCNKDGIINDGKYEYSTVGLPFLASLGRLFLDYEKGKVLK